MDMDALDSLRLALEGERYCHRKDNEYLLARVERAEAALRECVRLAGTDLSDGFPTSPPLHEFAVQEVRQLRHDYDEACEEAGDAA